MMRCEGNDRDGERWRVQMMMRDRDEYRNLDDEVFL